MKPRHRKQAIVMELAAVTVVAMVDGSGADVCVEVEGIEAIRRGLRIQRHHGHAGRDEGQVGNRVSRVRRRPKGTRVMLSGRMRHEHDPTRRRQ